MLKTSLTVLVTAAVCFGIAAASGFASSDRSSGRTINLKVGDTVIQASNNFHCQVLSKTQIACGGKKLAGQVSVYYSPTQLNVVKFNKAGTKATSIFGMKR
jgi:hypothetical protein